MRCERDSYRSTSHLRTTWKKSSLGPKKSKKKRRRLQQQVTISTCIIHSYYVNLQCNIYGKQRLTEFHRVKMSSVRYVDQRFRANDSLLTWRNAFAVSREDPKVPRRLLPTVYRMRARSPRNLSSIHTPTRLSSGSNSKTEVCSVMVYIYTLLNIVIDLSNVIFCIFVS